MSTLDLSVGAIEIGVLFSSILFGILTVQAFLYAEKNFEDPLYLRIMVWVIWLLETAHTVFIWDLLYTLTVKNYGKPSSIMDTHWTLAAAPVLTSFLGSMVQVFFAEKVRILSGRLIIPIISWIGAVLRCIGGVTLGVVLSHSLTIPDFFAKYQWLVTTQFILSSFIDILNTSSLCFYLLRRRSGARATQQLVDKLVMYTVETGLITSVCGVVIVVLSLALPHTLTDFGLFMVYPKLFSNSFFTSLNARRSLRKMGQDTSHATSTLVFTHTHSELENLPVPPLSPRRLDLSPTSASRILPSSASFEESSTHTTTSLQ